jgi:hypothetical protein
MVQGTVSLSSIHAYADHFGKVAHEGLVNGKWAVDNMIANGGWHYFTMPSCIAPGDYLLRTELIALHSAGNAGQAQCMGYSDLIYRTGIFTDLYNSLYGMRTDQGYR